MRIQRVVVNNFRRLPDIDLTVSGHLILIGESEAGKSSILSALHLLLGLPHSQLLPSIKLRDFTKPGKPLLIEVTLNHLGENDRAHFPDEISVVSDQDNYLTVRLEAQIDESDPDSLSVRRFCPHGNPGRQLSRRQLEQIGWVLLRADRSLHRELGASATGALKVLLEQTDLGDDQVNIAGAVDKIHKVLADADALQTIRNDLAAGVKSMLPGDTSADSFELLTSADPENSPLADVLLFVNEGGEDRSPISDQSDGIRSVVLLTLLSMASENQGLTGIDEPELHLHPNAQSALGRVLAVSQRQHILATHSGRIAAAFKPSEVVCLSQRRSARVLDASHEASTQLFMSKWWKSELVETLTSKTVLFVEGRSDRIIVEAAAMVSGRHLHKMGVHVVELEGSGAFKRLVDMLGENGYGIPTFGLCDRDAEREWAKALDITPPDLRAAGYYVCNPDLEAEVVSALGVERFIDMVLSEGPMDKRSFLHVCGSSELSEVTAKVAADYWRNKRNKVPVAVAVASQLTATSAGNLGMITDLIDSACDA